METEKKKKNMQHVQLRTKKTVRDVPTVAITTADPRKLVSQHVRLKESYFAVTFNAQECLWIVISCRSMH